MQALRPIATTPSRNPVIGRPSDDLPRHPNPDPRSDDPEGAFILSSIVVPPPRGVAKRERVEVERPFLLISTPRSGSDWFVNDSLRWRAPDYFREYFNPTTNFGRSTILRLAFGSENDWQNVALPWECEEDLCEYVHKATWCLDQFRYAKENYAAFKIGFFVKHFDCFALIGQRKLTFPGGSQPRSTEHWWVRYFQSLELNRELIDPEIARFITYAMGCPLDLRRKMVAAQVIATYQTIRECIRYGIPIIEYRRLLSLPSTPEVFDYLQGKVPPALLDEGLAERVVQTRRVSDKSKLYEAWNVEDFARELIDMIPAELQVYF
jgi:hypothetical protein